MARSEIPFSPEDKWFGKTKVDFKPLVALMYEMMGKSEKAKAM